MDLKDWLKKHKHTQVYIAQILGIKKRHMFDLTHKYEYPSRKLALKIESITAGEVKAYDLMFGVTNGKSDQRKDEWKCDKCGAVIKCLQTVDKPHSITENKVLTK